MKIPKEVVVLKSSRENDKGARIKKPRVLGNLWTAFSKCTFFTIENDMHTRRENETGPHPRSLVLKGHLARRLLLKGTLLLIGHPSP